MNFLDVYGYTPQDLNDSTYAKGDIEIDFDEPVVPLARPGTKLESPGGITGAYGAIAAGFDSGYTIAEEGFTWHEIKEKELELNDEIRKRSAKNSRKLGANQVLYDGSWLYEASQFVGTMAGSFKDPAMAASTGVSTALTATGVGTAVTLPIMGLGIYSSASKIEGGNAYKSLIEAGVTEETARDQADWAGRINGAIEAAGTMVLGKAVSPLFRTMVSKFAPKKVGALQQITPGLAAFQTAKGLAVGVTEEVLTETVQEVVTSYAEEKGKSIDNVLKDPLTSEELYDRLWDTAVSTFKGAAVLSSIGGGFSAHMYMKQVKQAQAGMNFFANLNAAAKDVKQAQNPHQAYQAFMASQMATSDENQQHTVYVRGDEFAQAMSASGVTMEELEQAMPDVAKQVKEAIKTGGDVEMDAEEFSRTIAGTKLGLELQQHTRLAEDALSYAEAVKQAQEYRAMKKDVIKHTFTDEKEADRFIEKLENDEQKKKALELVDRFEQQILEARPDMSKEEARAQAKMGAATVMSLVRRAHIPLDQVDALAPIVLGTGGTGEELHQVVSPGIGGPAAIKKGELLDTRYVRRFASTDYMKEDVGAISTIVNSLREVPGIADDHEVTGAEVVKGQMSRLTELKTRRGALLVKKEGEVYAKTISALTKTVKGMMEEGDSENFGARIFREKVKVEAKLHEVEEEISAAKKEKTDDKEEAKKKTKEEAKAKKIEGLNEKKAKIQEDLALIEGVLNSIEGFKQEEGTAAHAAAVDSLAKALEVFEAGKIFDSYEEIVKSHFDKLDEIDAYAETKEDFGKKIYKKKLYTEREIRKLSAKLDGAEANGLPEKEVRKLQRKVASLQKELPLINDVLWAAGILATGPETRGYADAMSKLRRALRKFDAALVKKADAMKKAENAAYDEEVIRLEKALEDEREEMGIEADRIIRQMADNLTFLYDAIPDDVRNRAKLWYVGAHKTALDWAKRYGIRLRQTAAVIAVYSPKNNWFNNLSQAERTLDIFYGEAFDFKPDQKMVDLATRLCHLVPEADEKKDEAASQTAEVATEAQKDEKTPKSEEEKKEEKKDVDRFGDVSTKSLREILSDKNPDLRTAAIWVRAYDETHNNRRLYVQTPEGGRGGLFKVDSGAPAKVVWAAYGPVVNALSILMDGSMDNVDKRLGVGFKVRDFYDNIYDPWEVRAATIDTHAVGANTLNVMSQNDDAVSVNFGSAGRSSSTAQKGSYPLHFDALKLAAKERGVTPREMQSITWEAIRALFPEKEKQGLRPKVAAVWKKFQAGELTQEEAQEEVVKVAGGFSKMPWEDVEYNDQPLPTYDRDHVVLRNDYAKAEEDPTIAVEAAPNPNPDLGEGSPLSEEEKERARKVLKMWDSLEDDDKAWVNEVVTSYAMEIAALLADARVSTLKRTFGGWDGTVNPSSIYEVEKPEKLIPVAMIANYLLDQQAVYCMSSAKIPGLEAQGCLMVDVLKSTEQGITDLYQKHLDTLRDNGDKIVWGFTSYDGILVSNFDQKHSATVKTAMKNAAVDSDWAVGTSYAGMVCNHSFRMVNEGEVEDAGNYMARVREASRTLKDYNRFSETGEEWRLRVRHRFDQAVEARLAAKRKTERLEERAGVLRQAQAEPAAGGRAAGRVGAAASEDGRLLQSKPVSAADRKLDAEYFDAIERGDTEAVAKMVQDRAREKGFDNAIPDQTDGYFVRTRPAPKKTVKAYKVFYVNAKTGEPSTLFVGGAQPIPQNVWIDAKEAFHIVNPKNGRKYVPTFSNPNRSEMNGKRKAGKTGDTIPVVDPDVRAELIKRGFIGEKAKTVTGVAFRPGWHAGTLPYFPQGGKKKEGSNYGNVHEWNQVVYEIEVAAEKDYTEIARSQEKARTKSGKVNARAADLDYLPKDGMYFYTTNPMLDPSEDGWVISDSIKIVRALSQEECDTVLKNAGKLPQEWEQGEFKLEDVGITDVEHSDVARKTLAPITYDENGDVIPLSQRFDESKDDVLYQQKPQKALYTFHNVSEQNLEKALQLGGLPVPSLGIGRQETGVTDFGELTLVGTKHMVDPEAGTPVYSADAYTNRFPEADWSKSVNKPAAKALSGEVAAWEKKFGDNDRSMYHLFYQPDRDKFLSLFTRSDLTKRAFLDSKGISIDPVMSEPQKLSPLLRAMYEQVQDVVASRPREEWAGAISQVYADAVESLGDAAGKFATKHAGKVRQGQPLSDNYVTLLVDKILSYDPDAKPGVDQVATGAKISEALSGLTDEYMEWVEAKTKDVFEAPKIKVGRKLVPMTLENIVAAMTKRDAKNTESTFGFGPGKVRAAVAKRFKTLQQIQDGRDLITDSKTVHEINKAIDDRFGAFRSAVYDAYQYSDAFEAFDDAMRALADAAKAKPTAERLRKALASNGFNVEEISDQVIEEAVEALTELKKGMTDYFEAKPQRAVRFEEFAGALVPASTSPEVVSALEGYGLQVKFYDPAVEGDRQEQLVELTDELDAVREDVLYQGEQKNAPATETRGGYSQSRNTITLTPNADLSTFSHEMGHWYLTNLFKVSQIEGVDQSVLDDVQAILNWFGLKSLDEWYALGTRGQVKYHERFAYSVEIYLATQKAPSRDTAGFFERLGKWIRDVYRELGGTVGSVRATYKSLFDEELPPVSDEVKRVLDRMIASEDMLEEAERVAGFVPLFESKPDDMTEQEWIELQRAHDDALNSGTELLGKARARDERWIQRARSRKLREIQQKGKEIRKKLESEVRKEVEKRPEVIAYDALRTGGKALGIDNLKFDADALRAYGIGDETIEQLRAMGVTKRGGLDPEDTRKLLYPVARFKSVKKMIAGLLTGAGKEDIIEKMVQQRAMEKYSDYFDPKKTEKLVSTALINEGRARMIATELRYLAGHDGTTSRVYVEASKRAAYDMLERTPLAKVSVKRYMAAASAASRKAFAALAKGDREEALRQKRVQMVQHQAALTAIDIEKQRRKMDELRKFAFRSDKKLSTSYDVGVVAYMRAYMVLRGLGPKGVDPAEAMKYVEQVKTYSQDERYARCEAVFHQSPAHRAGPAGVTVGQFLTAFEDIVSLKRMAREEKAMLLEGRRIEVEDAVDELVYQLERIDIKPQAFGVKRAVTDEEKRSRVLYTLKAFVTRVESWCAAADAGSEGKPFQRYIFRPIANAAARYRVENQRFQKALNDIIKPLRDSWANTRGIEFKDKNGRLIYTFERKAEFIGALLHTGNDSNKRKLLLGGRGDDSLPWGRMVELEDGTKVFDSSDWDNFVRQAVLDGILTAEDMRAVQAIWDLLESMKPIIQKAYFEYYGLYFKEIEAAPFTLPVGPGGAEVAFRGGYVPAVADPDVHEDQVAFDNKELMDQADFFDMFPVTRPGFSHERTNAVRPLRLNVGLVGSHIQKALKFAMIAPAALEVQKILRHPEFKKAVNKVDIKAINEMFAPWLKRSVEQTVGTPTTVFGRWLNKLRGLAGMSLMAGNVVNALQQLTGLSVALTKVGQAPIANALTQFMQGPKRMVEDVMSKSVFMKARLEDRAFEYQTELERIASPQDPKKIDEIKDFVGRKAYLLQTGVQMFIDVPVWTATYNQAVAQGMKEEDAVAEADSVVRTTQSAFDPETVSRVETGSPLWRSLLVFYNYFDMQLNLLGERWMVARQAKKYGQFAADAILIVLIPAVLSEVIAGAFSGFDTGDDEDWDAVDGLAMLTSAVARNVVAMIPMGGNVINVFGTGLAKSDVPYASEAARFIFGSNPFNDRVASVPVMTLIEGAARAPGSIYNFIEGDGNARSAARSMLDLMTVTTGLPFGSLKKPVGYAAGVASGDIEPEGALDVVKGVISGKDPEAK